MHDFVTQRARSHGTRDESRQDGELIGDPAPESVNINAPADLVGKRVGITRATLEETTVPKTPLLMMMQGKSRSRRCLLLLKVRQYGSKQ